MIFHGKETREQEDEEVCWERFHFSSHFVWVSLFFFFFFVSDSFMYSCSSSLCFLLLSLDIFFSSGLEFEDTYSALFCSSVETASAPASFLLLFISFYSSTREEVSPSKERKLIQASRVNSCLWDIKASRSKERKKEREDERDKEHPQEKNIFKMMSGFCVCTLVLSVSRVH